MTRNLPPASPANSAVMFVAFVIGTAGARNIEPSGWIVHAGSCRSAFLPGAPLAFTARTIPANVSVTSWHWDVSLAPASAKVTFSSPNSPTTTAAFSSDGVYRLSATADGRVGTLVVEVYDTRLGTHDGTPRNFSYHLDTLQKVFTGDANLPIDPVAVAALKANPSITAVPAVGVHPRVLFSPGDLPDIRHRLATTVPGRAVFTQIRDRIVRQISGGTDSLGRFYTLANRTGKGGSGPDPEGALFDMAAAGNLTGVLNTSSAVISNVAALIVYTGFVELIDPSTLPAGTATRAAAALTTIARYSTTQLTAVLPPGGCTRWDHVKCNYQNVAQGVVFREFLGLGYDFLAGELTSEQAEVVRHELSLATTQMWSIGLDALRSASTDTSNWCPTHMMHLLINTLAIEGEEGYDPTLLPRIEAGYERFLTIGLTRDGATFEGMGKDSVLSEVLLILARRGSVLPTLTNVVGHVRNFYFAVTSPLGWTSQAGNPAGAFTWDEMLGGVQELSRYADVAVIKHLYPDDPVIDFVFMAEMGNLTRLRDFNIRFPYSGMDFLHRAISARDWAGAGTNTSFDVLQAGLTSLPSANLTHFFGTRGLLTARSNWTPTSMQLLFQPRNVIGGHDQLDRTKIGLAAGGRWWFPYRPVDQPATAASVIYVNGRGSSTIPAAIKAVYTSGDSGIATFATSDATITYSREFASGFGTEPAGFVPNDFFLDPAPEPAFSRLPYSDQPNWLTSCYTQNNVSVLNASTQVSRAYRTVGMVRGTAGSPKCSKTAYVLVIDDYAKADGASALFTWRALLAPDLNASNISCSGSQCVLTDTLPAADGVNPYRMAPAAGARLLVRQLRPLPSLAFGVSYAHTEHDNIITTIACLDANVTATAAGFVTLLFPLEAGEPLPTTEWTGSGVKVTTASGCVDTLSLVSDPTHPFDRVEFSRAAA